MGTTKLNKNQIVGTLSGETLDTEINKLSEALYKVIVFVIPGILKDGVQKSVIRFPFDGIIEQVYASCSTAGSSQTTIEVQKCSQDFIDGVVGATDWTNIFTTNLTIEANKRSSNTSLTQPVISPTEATVTKNDHFRLNVVENGQLQDLTVEITIKI